MTDKEVSKLNRKELLEILLCMSKENEQLKKEIEELKEELKSRRIIIENSGSIAEAALKLNGIFEAAQQSADQYLENIRELTEQPKLLKEKDEIPTVVEDTNEINLLFDNREEFIKEYEEKERKITLSYYDGSSDYYNELLKRLETFCDEHTDLKDIIDENIFKTGDNE